MRQKGSRNKQSKSSKTPIQPGDFKSLYGYLSSSLDFCIFIEIYTSTPDDAFACVEHQRREVAHRKRLYRDSEESSEYKPPLTPTFNPASRSSSGHVNNAEPKYDTGACLLLVSDSYRAGEEIRKKETNWEQVHYLSTLVAKFPMKYMKLIWRTGLTLTNWTIFRLLLNSELKCAPKLLELSSDLFRANTAWINMYNQCWAVYRCRGRSMVKLELDYRIDDLSSVQGTWDSP